LLHLSPPIHPSNGVWVLVTQYTSNITFTSDPSFVVSVPQTIEPASLETLHRVLSFLVLILSCLAQICFFFLVILILFSYLKKKKKKNREREREREREKITFNDEKGKDPEIETTYLDTMSDWCTTLLCIIFTHTLTLVRPMHVRRGCVNIVHLLVV